MITGVEAIEKQQYGKKTGGLEMKEVIAMFIPNILSILRIILSVLLVPSISSPAAFIIIYIAAGVSDVLDGYIARRFGYESDLGAKLDSISDMIFFCILIFIFFRLYPSVINENLIFLLIIAAIRIMNILITRLKYGRITFVHTLGNKISGILLFTMPILLLFTNSNIPVRVVLGIVSAAAVEELLITIKYKEPGLNRKSIFFD